MRVKLVGILYYNFPLDFEFWRQKLSKFNYFQFLIVLFSNKITIFGAKIQIIQAFFPLKKIKNYGILCFKIHLQKFEVS